MDYWFDDVDSLNWATIAALIILIGDIIMFIALYSAVRRLDYKFDDRYDNIDNKDH